MSPIHHANEFLSPWVGVAVAAAGAAAPDAWVLATGIPVNVLMMALAGSLLALRFTSRAEGRATLLFGVLANTGFAAALAVFMPHVPGFDWMKAVPAPVGALLAGLVCQFALPVLIEELPKRVRAFKLRRNP